MGSNVAAAIVRGSNSSFRYSFSFLPKHQREALRVVYAFCRKTDDIVDSEIDTQTRIEQIRSWRFEWERALSGNSSYPLLNQLSGVAQKFHIPVHHFNDVIRGVEMDLTRQRYESFEDLREYCELVASSVGLMCVGIFSPKNQRTTEYATALGIALQLTNIVRDVGIDASYGRIYLPLEDLRQFGCTESEILSCTYTPRFKALMAFEAERAEGFFRLAQSALPPEDRKAMFAATIMERIYYHTLLRIRAAEYNVFDGAIHLPRSVQFLIALKYWITQRLLGS